MDAEIRDAVAEWGTRPVADGVAGLYDLADAGFSGAVTDGTAWAYVLNGRFVGVFDGDVEDFEDSSLTAYTAPDRSLPLLFAMQERGGETRGRYYSNEMSLREIDDTLSAGNFVGYVELSENVLSGDYYVVYYGGRALPVAWVGNSRRLLTGDEAFERAADEVGIYSVVDAEVEVTDLPERPDPEPASTVADVDGDEAVDENLAGTTDEDSAGTAEEDPTATADDGGFAGDAGGIAVTDDGASADGADDATAAGSTGDAPMDADADAPGGTSDAPGNAPTEESTTPQSVAFDEAADVSIAATSVESEETTGEDDGESPPASEGASDSSPADAEAPTTEAATEVPDRGETDASFSTTDEVEMAEIPSAESDPAAAATGTDETARLRDRIAELEAEVERLEAETGQVDEPKARTLAPEAARSGTHLFVRYEDRSEGTLDDAVAGRVPAADLRANLRLEFHTEFETDGVRIEGESFESFLRGTVEHRFAEWLLTDLLYEIQRTDSAGVSKLYQALDGVDRIDLDDEVAVETDAGEETASFDVVFRDKMGDPLFVADFDESREPTRAPSIRSLVDGARSVGEGTPSFAAAFSVTTSFFDADAMRASVEATRGGVFSRSSRNSYVKLSRKAGFHLCLAEARDGEFYLTVPEL